MHSPIPDWLAAILDVIGWALAHPVLTVLLTVGTVAGVVWLWRALT